MSEVPLSLTSEALEFAETLALEMGEVIRTRATEPFAIRKKRDGSLVTDIDLFVEREVRRRIRERWPDHSVEGEEEGADAASTEYRWLVDPIDGTMSLAHGVPLFGTILALRRKGHSVVGVINLPMLNRCYGAGLRLGARRNGEPLRSTNSGDGEAEIIALGDRQQFERAGLAAAFDTIMTTHPWARTYTDCFGHCLAIEGAVGAMLDPATRLWDFAATEVLVREAGGRFERRSLDDSKGFNVLFGKPGVVQWVLDRISW